MKLEQAIENNSVILNVGSGIGANVKPEYVNIDIVNDSRLDIVHDITKPLPIPDNTADKIINEHVLEHIQFKYIQSIIHDWFRVLKSGGEVYVNVPNIVNICRMFIEDKDRRWSYWSTHLFGGQKYDTDCHVSGFEPCTLIPLFEKAGFVKIKVKPIGDFDRAFILTAKKP